MESRLSSTTIFVEYLVNAEIRNDFFNISFTNIHNHSGKIPFANKHSGKSYEASFMVTGEPLSARVYITIVLFGAKFYRFESGIRKGSHLITSRAQSLYQKIEAITSIE